jgi:serine/threonine protein kinase
MILELHIGTVFPFGLAYFGLRSCSRGCVFLQTSDLKPENLLLTGDGCLKITDFGNGECFRMAWETKAHLSHGVCGSEPYIAPEVFAQDSFDPRPVDVWACGIIYMGMLTARHMWRAAKSPEDNNYRTFLEARERGSTVSIIRELGSTRCHVISQIIEPNPRHRMTVEEITQHPWFLSLNNCHESFSPVAVLGPCSAVSGQVPAMAEGSAVVHV